MRLLFCALLLFAGCGDDQSPEEQCANGGVQSVDGVRCCFYLHSLGDSCDPSEKCIPDIVNSCSCREDDHWHCGAAPINRDLSIADLSPRDN